MNLSAKILDISVYPSGWARATIAPSPAQADTLRTVFFDHDQRYAGRMIAVGESLVTFPKESEVVLTGKITNHARFGLQFEVSYAELFVPADADALEMFLARRYQKLGIITARKIVDHYDHRGALKDLQAKLQHNPDQVDFSDVLGTTNAVFSVEDDRTLFDLIASHLYRMHMDADIKPGVWKKLGEILGTQVSPEWHKYAKQIRHLSDDEARNIPVPPVPYQATESAHAAFQSNPYQFIENGIRNYKFQEADRIGARLGIPRDDPRRLSALGPEAVRTLCNNEGHTYLNAHQFLGMVSKMDPSIAPSTIFRAAQHGQIELLVLEEGTERVYTRFNFALEKDVAKSLQTLALAETRSLGNPDTLADDLNRIQAEKGLRLDASQVNALTGLLSSSRRLHTLTGGPGRGKTTVVMLLEQLAANNGKNGIFAAPTGKAALVLSKRINRPVSTIHRLLEPLDMDSDGLTSRMVFTYNTRNTLRADYVVVDEASMVDLELASALLDALSDTTHLIILGDPGQLPSVGPGRFLEDLLQIPGDHHRLETTHRNTGHLLDLIGAIGDGTLESVVPTEDILLHKMDLSEPTALTDLIDIYLSEVQRYGTLTPGPTSGFRSACLLTPRRKGTEDTPALNISYLNGAIQKRVNPLGEKVPTLASLRLGDRVIVRKNITDPIEKEVIAVNGDTGVLIDFAVTSRGVHTSLENLRIAFDDSRVETIEARHLPDGADDFFSTVELAYAMTVHSAQGSEYQSVVFAIDTHSRFVDRRMVYTAISRAKSRLILCGSANSVVKAAKTEPVQRQCALLERTREGLSAANAWMNKLRVPPNA